MSTPDDGPTPPESVPGPPGPEPTPPHGAHGRPLTRGQKWTAYKESPYFPATVLLFILAAAAGLFAGSYTYAMANPTPHRIPAAVVSLQETARGKAFVTAMDEALDASSMSTGTTPPPRRARPWRSRRSSRSCGPAGRGWPSTWPAPRARPSPSCSRSPR